MTSLSLSLRHRCRRRLFKVARAVGGRCKHARCPFLEVNSGVVMKGKGGLCRHSLELHTRRATGASWYQTSAPLALWHALLPLPSFVIIQTYFHSRGESGIRKSRLNWRSKPQSSERATDGQGDRISGYLSCVGSMPRVSMFSFEASKFSSSTTLQSYLGKTLLTSAASMELCSVPFKRGEQERRAGVVGEDRHRLRLRLGGATCPIKFGDWQSH